MWCWRGVGGLSDAASWLGEFEPAAGSPLVPFAPAMAAIRRCIICAKAEVGPLLGAGVADEALSAAGDADGEGDLLAALRSGVAKDPPPPTAADVAGGVAFTLAPYGSASLLSLLLTSLSWTNCSLPCVTL